MKRETIGLTSIFLSLAVSISSLAASLSVKASAIAELDDIFQEEWSRRLQEDPLEATLVGFHAENHRMPDVSLDSLASRYAFDQELLQRLRGIDRSMLPAQHSVSRDLFEFYLESRVSRYGFGEYRIPFTNDSGFFSSLVYAFQKMPLNRVEDFDVYLVRLAAIPKYLLQNTTLMRLGIDTGFTMPKPVMPGVEKILSGMAKTSSRESPLYGRYHDRLSVLPASKRESYERRCLEILEQFVIPAYQNLEAFVRSEYSPKCRNSIGANELSDGAEYYRFLVRYFTTLTVEPEEVHAIGLREVARIRGEMESILRSIQFDGDFAAFLSFLRTDSQFYAKSPEQLLKEASWISKRIDGMLPEYFGALPRMPYGVAAVPEHLAPNYTTGRYSPGVPGGDRGGFYWVNTFALEKRPLYVLPALTLHEAVPGHHLQIALAQELSGLPEFRRHFYPNAFGEGWALYAEKLGKEMGVYQSPYEEFGRLTYEMWRAGRLVVDTGIHFMGWSREQAVSLFVENSALSLHNIETEVDRYISWPGQALSYKMGELTIIRLRQHAEKILEAGFDLRSFHDVILKNGGVTMPVLEAEIQAYIRRSLMKQ